MQAIISWLATCICNSYFCCCPWTKAFKIFFLQAISCVVAVVLQGRNARNGCKKNLEEKQDADGAVSEVWEAYFFPPAHVWHRSRKVVTAKAWQRLSIRAYKALHFQTTVITMSHSRPPTCLSFMSPPSTFPPSCPFFSFISWDRRHLIAVYLAGNLRSQWTSALTLPSPTTPASSELS